MVLTNLPSYIYLIFASPVIPTDSADTVIHPNEENNAK